MSRLNQVTPEVAVGTTKDLYDRVKRVVGRVPNLHQVIGNSSASLEGYLQFAGAVNRGKLTERDRQLIALAVGEVNGCDYCLSAHTTIGKMVGLSAEQIRDARRGTPVDRRAEAIVLFARRVAETRGRVSDEDLREFRDAGFDEEAVVEVVANVGLNFFTNLTNNVAQTEIDWPRAETLEPVHETV